ncbi:MAG: hypothetical protein M1834_001824 [Cirrosporium novae-zelandiae]|nr:MAG: hypothetical protein M1834_001824 [Cirrosporium novae-zelandiae]
MSRLVSQDVFPQRRSIQNHESDDDSISLTSTIASEHDDDDEYQVECILGQKGTFKDREYLVRWAGYPDDRCSWEPRSSFLETQPLEDWKEQRKRIRAGKVKAFDVDAWEHRQNQLEERSKLRRMKRKEKKARMALEAAEARHNELKEASIKRNNTRKTDKSSANNPKGVRQKVAPETLDANDISEDDGAPLRRLPKEKPKKFPKSQPVRQLPRPSNPVKRKPGPAPRGRPARSVVTGPGIFKNWDAQKKVQKLPQNPTDGKLAIPKTAAGVYRYHKASIRENTPALSDLTLIRPGDLKPKPQKSILTPTETISPFQMILQQNVAKAKNKASPGKDGTAYINDSLDGYHQEPKSAALEVSNSSPKADHDSLFSSSSLSQKLSSQLGQISIEQRNLTNESSLDPELKIQPRPPAITYDTLIRENPRTGIQDSYKPQEAPMQKLQPLCPSTSPTLLLASPSKTLIVSKSLTQGDAEKFNSPESPRMSRAQDSSFLTRDHKHPTAASYPLSSEAPYIRKGKYPFGHIWVYLTVSAKKEPIGDVFFIGVNKFIFAVLKDYKMDDESPELRFNSFCNLEFFKTSMAYTANRICSGEIDVFSDKPYEYREKVLKRMEVLADTLAQRRLGAVCHITTDRVKVTFIMYPSQMYEWDPDPRVTRSDDPFQPRLRFFVIQYFRFIPTEVDRIFPPDTSFKLLPLQQLDKGEGSGVGHGSDCEEPSLPDRPEQQTTINEQQISDPQLPRPHLSPQPELPRSQPHSPLQSETIPQTELGADSEQHITCITADEQPEMEQETKNLYKDIDDMFRKRYSIVYKELLPPVQGPIRPDRIPDNFFLHFPDSPNGEAECDRWIKYIGRHSGKVYAERYQQWSGFKCDTRTGVVLFHSSFKDFPSIPGLFQLLKRFYHIYSVDLHPPPGEPYITQLFRYGFAVCIPESLFKQNLSDAAFICEFFAKHVESRVGKHFRLFLPPGFKDWLRQLAHESEVQDGKVDDRLKRIYKVIFPHLPNAAISPSEAETYGSTRAISVPSYFWPQYGTRVSPPDWTQCERNDDQLAQAFTQWANGQVANHRRFYLVHGGKEGQDMKLTDWARGFLHVINVRGFCEDNHVTREWELGTKRASGSHGSETEGGVTSKDGGDANKSVKTSLAEKELAGQAEGGDVAMEDVDT